MQISEFFNIFDLSNPNLDKVNYFVSERDYPAAKKELLRYFINRKKLNFSKAEPITEKDKNFPLAYISRHFIISGPNESDLYLSSMFLAKTNEYTSMDILPFIKEDLSFMIMSRQKENAGALFYSPTSIFPPYVQLVLSDKSELTISCQKFAYISTKSPDFPLSDEDIYEICEESDSPDKPFGSNTGRVYLNFDFSTVDLSKVISARFLAKISLPENVERKELLFFNISDSSWDNSLTWNKVLGNIYSWESSPEGPTWEKPEGSDSEYLNVACRFWFARPMAYQYLSDVEKNSIYGERLLFLMDSFSKQKEGGFNRVLETGERLSNFTSVLHALIDTPLMTPDYLVSILSMMYQDMEHLMTNPDLGWSNWAVVRTSGLSKAIDFLPELKRHEDWKRSTRNLLESLFDKMYSHDFSFREAGLAYSFWCCDLFVSAYNSSVINNDPFRAFFRNRLEKVFDATIDLLYPNFYDTNIGDSNYNSRLPYLLNVGKTFPTKKLTAFLKGKDDEDVSLSKYYPDGNIAVMRNTFEKKNAAYLMLSASPFDGHSHEDLGNVIFYAYSRPLITDSGRYGYSQSSISSHLKEVSAHNTIEIEGAPYTPHSKSGSQITAFISGPLFDYAESTANISEEINAIHKRCVFFLKSTPLAIVSDFVSTSVLAQKFKQNWHFLPEANMSYDFSNHVKTNFEKDGNITILCPDAELLECDYDIFSSGYGMAKKNSKASFVKHGDKAEMTTLLFPYDGEEPKVTASSLSEDGSVHGIKFSVDSKKKVFLSGQNTLSGDEEYSSDALSSLIGEDWCHFAHLTRFTHSSKVMIESSTPIRDISIKISSGIVEIESTSLSECTKRDEAARIYAPKTTHVLLNGKSIPFTLYSDYVYAVKAK